MHLEDLDSPPFSLDTFLHRPLFQTTDPVELARACVEAHTRGYSSSGILHAMESISAKDRTNDQVRALLDPVRRAIDTVTVLVCALVFPFDGYSESGFLGGSEEAVVGLCRGLARLGRRVVVYTRLPPFTVSGTSIDGVEYRDTIGFNPDGEHGTLVVWRQPEAVKDVLDPTFLRPGLTGLHMWMHDAGCKDPRTYTEVAPTCDSVSTLTPYHKRCLQNVCDDARYVQVPNGIETRTFPNLDDIERDTFRVAYTSCPSRGLRVLLDAWPEVRRAVPNAHLDVCYDWTAFEAQYPTECVRMRHQIDALEGVRLHGGLSHADLHKLLARTNVWAYSHFHLTHMETFCISAIKALAMGCTVLTVPNGALPDVIGEDGRFVTTPQEYIDALVFALQHPEDDDTRRVRATRIRNIHDWSQVAETVTRIWTCHVSAHGSWRYRSFGTSSTVRTGTSRVVRLDDFRTGPATNSITNSHSPRKET